jgi:hypothetical protein
MIAPSPRLPAWSAIRSPSALGLFERRRLYRQLLGTMSRERATLGELEPAIAHFLKITKS